MTTFADDMRAEQLLLHRRVVHATRPKGKLTLQEAADLAARMAADPPAVSLAEPLAGKSSES